MKNFKFLQIFGVLHVAKLNTIRLLVALATKHNWRIHQLDVKSTFLNGDLKEEVYLLQLGGFV